MNLKENSNANRQAWNEAQSMVPKDYQKQTIKDLKEGKNKIHSDILMFLEPIVKDKKICQFCCNNGRELLSLHKYGPSECVGFDISDALITEAKLMASELKYDCTFIQSDIYDIVDYQGYFDVLFITIGVLSWFENLDKFFNRVVHVLKNEGIVIIHEAHPFINIFAFPQEKEFDPDEPAKIMHSYFKKEPWIEEDGMYYMVGKQYKSKPFISFSQTFSNIINSVSNNGLKIIKLLEFEHDIGSIGSPVLDNKGVPLSFLLEAKKAI